MKEGPDIARIAALIGDPARANMLVALMSGKALTATELAAEAGITAQTASSHLARLHEGGLLLPRKQGRHKYFALASTEVASVLEALMGLAADSGLLRSRTGPKDKALRQARICYNHLAGDMGVQMFDSLVAQGYLAWDGGRLRLTEPGRDFAAGLGIDVGKLTASRSELCRECLDWSERRSHLAGSLGRAMLARFVEMGWARVDKSTRIVTFTPSSLRQFRSMFDLRDAA
ncbi:MAG TPA: winged helix-turn-helix domain-containing protein [Pelagibacterium sp.]|uniref:ArsR/SmtB family transcription factor n=1 Tax=Pelagibacterium sp. TaxID=1967288 RepID=UPI002C609855|nr:winged helix-turn-helix domain-containing protein [Pelagibacterium sp.]HWJ88459.1 winged helix-turn-helix domain-containing protein [Pelagibacterium sp.]